MLEEGTDVSGDGKLDAGEVDRTFALGMRVIAQATKEGAAVEVLNLLADVKGTTRATFDTAINAVTATFDYDAGGSPIGFTLEAAPTSILYANQYLDALSGLSYNRGRWYDPSTRTFTRVDDYRPGVGNWVDSNLLHYAGGDPVNASDPTGMFSLTELMVSMTIGAIATSMLDQYLVPIATKVAETLIPAQLAQTILTDLPSAGLLSVGLSGSVGLGRLL